MNFIKGITNGELFGGFLELAKKKSSKVQTEKEDKQEKPDLDSQLIVSYSQAEQFMLFLSRESEQQKRIAKNLKRKINIFEKLQIQPLYLQQNYQNKILKFEFQAMDEPNVRMEELLQHFHGIQYAVQMILDGKMKDFEALLHLYQEYILLTIRNIKKIEIARRKISIVKQSKQMIILKKITQRNIIKQKLKLAKSMKQKNQTFLMQITNLDQAFYTQRSRQKLYNKIHLKQKNQYSQNKKAAYTTIFESKLLNLALNDRDIVEENIFQWQDGRLNNKQIQKLAIMLYFIENQPMFTRNKIQINYSKFNKKKMIEQIRGLKNWKDFKYINDRSMSGKIHQFLDFLQTKFTDILF